jgi:hypothetical protein
LAGFGFGSGFLNAEWEAIAAYDCRVKVYELISRIAEKVPRIVKKQQTLESLLPLP